MKPRILVVNAAHPARGRMPNKARRGFSLVELAIVIALISVLGALATYSLRRYLAYARSAEAIHNVSAIGRSVVASYSLRIMDPRVSDMAASGNGASGGKLAAEPSDNFAGDRSDKGRGKKGGKDDDDHGDDHGDDHDDDHGDDHGGNDHGDNHDDDHDDDHGDDHGHDHDHDDDEGGGSGNPSGGNPGGGNGNPGGGNGNPGGGNGNPGGGNGNGDGNNGNGDGSNGATVVFDTGFCDDSTAVPASMNDIKGKKYQPVRAPDHDYHTGNASTGWRCLRYENDTPHSYQYRYTLSGPPITVYLPHGGTPNGAAGGNKARQWTAYARGDLNGDGRFSWFILSGEVDKQGIVMAPGVAIQDQEE